MATVAREGPPLSLSEPAEALYCTGYWALNTVRNCPPLSSYFYSCSSGLGLDFLLFLLLYPPLQLNGWCGTLRLFSVLPPFLCNASVVPDMSQLAQKTSAVLLVLLNEYK